MMRDSINFIFPLKGMLTGTILTTYMCIKYALKRAWSKDIYKQKCLMWNSIYTHVVWSKTSKSFVKAFVCFFFFVVVVVDFVWRTFKPTWFIMHIAYISGVLPLVWGCCYVSPSSVCCRPPPPGQGQGHRPARAVSRDHCYHGDAR